MPKGTSRFESRVGEPVAAKVLGHPLFNGMPPEIAHDLLHESAMLHVEDGDYLFHEGEEATEFLYVCRGCVEVLRYTMDGQERMFYVYHSNQLLAETAMFMSHGRYPMHARARGDVIVQCLKRASLVRVCEAWPLLSLRLLTRLSDRVYHRINEVEWFSDSTAAQRLADYLLRLPRNARQAVWLPLTQRQLASNLGVRAETLNRLFSDWVAREIILGKRRDWTLQDLDFLESLAQPVRRDF